MTERWVKAPEGYQAILAQKRWNRYYSPKALDARRRRMEIEHARRAGEPEWETQQRFHIMPKRTGRKFARSAELPVDPLLLTPAQPKNRFLGENRPWLWDPEFRPRWLTFLRLRRQCSNEADYRVLVDLTRPHAEAALARWHAFRAEMGSRTVRSRPGGHRGPLPKRRWDPGTLSTNPRAMWPAYDATEGDGDTLLREDRENHRRGDCPADPAPAQVAVGDPEGRPAGA